MSKFMVTMDGQSYEVETPLDLPGIPLAGMSNGQISSAACFLVNNQPVKVIIPETGSAADDTLWLIINDRSYEVMVDPDMGWIKSRWGIHSLEILDLDTIAPPHRTGNGLTGNGRIKAPIPGSIVRVMITMGESVEPGQPLFILEAMKMENEIRAHQSGIIKTINVSPGQSVSINQVLAEFE